MLINEVIHTVGLSRKSIQYYEKVNLIKPKRNDNNQYRIYTDDDINKLKVIKFLRELDIPIKEIKLLDEGNISLKECMQDRIDKIETEKEQYDKIKNMCLEIYNSNDTIKSINIDKYFLEINKLNKDGFTMLNTKANHKKKIMGAIISSVVFEILFISIISSISYFQITTNDKIPWIIYIIFMFLFLMPIIAIIYNLVIRIKEIKGGEEDEACKY